MYLKVEQTTKNLYDEKFIIMDKNGNEIGNATSVGHLGSMEAKIQINVLNNCITLKLEYKSFSERLLGMIFSGKIFRPYTVTINNKEVGRIGTKYIKQKGQIATKELCLDGDVYKNFFCGLGEKGRSYSIYENDTEIAEIHKENVVINGLHVYEAKYTDDNYIIPTLIHCFYIHVFSYYLPGKKFIGKQTFFSLTKDIESKYNPDFWDKY